MNIDKKLILSMVFLVCGLAIAVVLYLKFFNNSGSSGKAGLSVNASYGQATVILDGTLIGKTPYESQTLKPGEHTLSVKADQGSYETKIQLVSQAQTAVTREVGTGKDFFAGNVVWMEKISGDSTSVSIITNPTNAVVKLDTVEKGTAPLTLNDVSEGSHTIEISKDGYETQSVFLKFKRGFKLNVIADLFLIPISENLEGTDYSTNVKIYKLTLSVAGVSVEPSIWAKAVSYFGKTRGKPVNFDFLIDSEGTIYDSNGTKVTLDAKSLTKTNYIIGYLSKDQGELSDKAKETLGIFGPGAFGSFVKVIPTGVGFLRVRDKPSLNGTEIARINEGEEFLMLEEGQGWTKIKLPDGKEGWASSTYLEKVEEE